MTAQLAPVGIAKFWDNNGFPLSFGQLTTYAAGTTTPQATYVDSTQTTQNTNPIQLNFRGECNLWLDPTKSYKFLLQDLFGNTIPGWPVDNITIGNANPSFNIIPISDNLYTLGSPTFSWANVYVGANHAPIFDPVSGNVGYYARTTAEVGLGITPADFSYPPGYVDRYAVNTVPGTTDMASAFTSAAKVANQIGCNVRWGATAPYALNTAVNGTGLHGVVFTDESSGGVSNSAFASIIAGNNGGHTFDLSTSYECVFNNLAVKTKAATVPLTLFFCARNPSGSDAGLHRFNNIKVASNSTFSVIGYQYGSEQNTWFNCFIQGSQPGSTLLSWNTSNPQGWTSTFVSIATGNQSNVEHRAIGCSFFNFGNSTLQNETCIQLESVGNVKIEDGLFFTPHGRSYVDILGSQASNYIAFRNMRGEVGGVGNQPLYGYWIANSAGTSTQITLDNCQGDVINELVRFNTGVVVQNLNIRNGCSAVTGKTLSAYTLTDSIIETLQSGLVTGQVGGTIANNVFIGARTNITLSGTANSNLYADVFGGVYGLDGDVFTSASTACTGALTTAITYQIRLSPNGKTITLNLPSIQGTTTAAASFTLGVAIPAAYRPTQNLRYLVAIVDNGGSLNQPGQVVIVAATGVVTIFKDIVGTGNWTNGTTGGLASGTEITWNL